jgi:hypothetical protein
VAVNLLANPSPIVSQFLFRPEILYVIPARWQPEPRQIALHFVFIDIFINIILS